MTTVLPTSRAIRQRILSLEKTDGFVPRFMTMGELMNRSAVVEGFRRVDRDTRTLTLLEAADFSAFSSLDIEKNFFTFTRNAAYIFRFFEELAGELVDIDSLDTADTYGDYAEHIEILRTLRERYGKLCRERRILDPVFLPEQYRLNEGWVRSLKGLTVEAEGYLTNFEMRLLEEMAQLVEVRVVFEADAFNRKMQEKFAERGIETREGFRCTVDLGRRTVLDERPVERNTNIRATALSERILQAAFVKQKVYEMVRDGIDPERIAVVLPEENFAPFLRSFDEEANFNFAMGVSLSQSRFVAVAEALAALAQNRSVENRLRVRRLYEDGGDFLTARYNEPTDVEGFGEIVGRLLETEPERAAREAVEEELYHFRRLCEELGPVPLRQLLHLFLNRLREKSLDDVRGGKVTVMGVLETRSCHFDGVVIVDFNEAYVPHKNEKDLFINSAVRERAGLPGTQEREALQKLFYDRLMRRAKRVEISCVSSETVLPSRFLRELGIALREESGDAAWARILFTPSPVRRPEPVRIEAEYDFTQRSLSATGLKSFLECRRRFYHRYVEGLAEHRMPREMPEEYEMGNALHAALSEVYSRQDVFTEVSRLKAAVAEALARNSGTTELERFLQRLWLKRLEPFFEREIERFREVRVEAVEKRLAAEAEGIRIEGRIDRIDLGPEGLEVLDYKSGKYPLYTPKNVDGATDFQLEFYYLLASERGEVAWCGYYDLAEGKIEKEPLMERKLELLREHLRTLAGTKRFEFDMTDDVKRCRYCPYASLCGREM